jgi:hypothetical protein
MLKISGVRGSIFLGRERRGGCVFFRAASSPGGSLGVDDKEFAQAVSSYGSVLAPYHTPIGCGSGDCHWSGNRMKKLH